MQREMLMQRYKNLLTGLTDPEYALKTLKRRNHVYSRSRSAPNHIPNDNGFSVHNHCSKDGCGGKILIPWNHGTQKAQVSTISQLRNRSLDSWFSNSSNCHKYQSTDVEMVD